MAQITRTSTMMMVLMYRLTKGRLVRASAKLDQTSFSGKIVGGICTLSARDFREVRIIHRKGKIISREPAIRKR